MPLVLKLAGVDRTARLRPGTLQVPDRLNARSEASFALSVKAGGYHPQPLDAVEMILDGGAAFRGFVWDVEEQRITPVPGSVASYLNVSCVDLHLLADRRVVTESYDGWTAGAIVTDLRAKYLAADGITLGTVQAGPVVSRAVFNYVSLDKCMDELAELAGFYWQIGHDRALQFADKGANAAPWAVNTAAPVKELTVRLHRERYRNTQIERAGTDKTDPRTDTVKGDGKTKAFPLNYPVAEVPTLVRVTFSQGLPGQTIVNKTVGIRGVDQGKDWYWNKDSEMFTQDDGGTPLRGDADVGGPDVLSVTYRGLFPIVVIATDPAEIAARAAAEGGTGIFEEVEQVGNIDTQGAATQYAEAKLAKHARLNSEVTFRTRFAGLRTGQLLPVNMPAHGVNGQYLISEVVLSDEGKLGQHGRWSYSVKALDGGEVGGWVEFFKRLTQAGKTFAIRENEVLIRLKKLGDGLKLGDSLALAKAAPVKTVGSATVGYAEVG